MKNKKIIILALVLLIIAGIIVVGLKGFNVDFMLKQHESIEYTISEDFELSDIENIAKDVFGDKKFEIRIIELFDDAVSINAENITTEEAENLIKKLDEKYKKSAEDTTEEVTVDATVDATEDVTTDTTETENTDENSAVENVEESENTISNYEIISNPKIKLFSLFKPYILPSILSGLAIVIYIGFRYRKLNSIKVIANLLGTIVLSVLAILSVIAIVRFPVNIWVFPIIMIIVLIELIIFSSNQENKLKDLNKEE